MSLKRIVVYSLVACITLFVSSLSFAQSNCLDKSDLEQISTHFYQFKQFSSLENGNCESKMGTEWFVVAKSLIFIRDMGNIRPPINENSGNLTHIVLKEGNWFEYLKQRVDRFDFTPIACKKGIDAYIWPHIPGEINICPSAFISKYRIQSILTFSSLLIHEARHFDGKLHPAKCFMRNIKTCDPDLEFGGAYALELQFLAQALKFPIPKISGSDAFWARKLIPRIQLAHFNKPQWRTGSTAFTLIGNSGLELTLVYEKGSGKILAHSQKKYSDDPRIFGNSAFRILLFSEAKNPIQSIDPYSEVSIFKEGRDFYFDQGSVEFLEKYRDQIVDLEVNPNHLTINVGNNILVHCEGKETILDLKAKFLFTTYDESLSNHTVAIDQSGIGHLIKCGNEDGNAVQVETSTIREIQNSIIDIVRYDSEFLGLNSKGQIVLLDEVQSGVFAEGPLLGEGFLGFTRIIEASFYDYLGPYFSN